MVEDSTSLDHKGQSNRVLYEDVCWSPDNSLSQNYENIQFNFPGYYSILNPDIEHQFPYTIVRKEEVILPDEQHPTSPIPKHPSLPEQDKPPDKPSSSILNQLLHNIYVDSDADVPTAFSNSRVLAL